MLIGMVIPGDAVEEEDEESTEGVSSDGYRTPSPSSEEYVFKPLERRGRAENRSIKGME